MQAPADPSAALYAYKTTSAAAKAPKASNGSSAQGG